MQHDKSDVIDKTLSGAHFTNNFSITIQMWWKFHFALIQILIKWLLQYLALGTTAGTKWHIDIAILLIDSIVRRTDF